MSVIADQYADKLRRSRTLVDTMMKARFTAATATDDAVRLAKVSEAAHAMWQLHDHANEGWRKVADLLADKEK